MKVGQEKEVANSPYFSHPCHHHFTNKLVRTLSSPAFSGEDIYEMEVAPGQVCGTGWTGPYLDPFQSKVPNFSTLGHFFTRIYLQDLCHSTTVKSTSPRMLFLPPLPFPVFLPLPSQSCVACSSTTGLDCIAHI